MEISNSASGLRINLELIKSSLLDALRPGQLLQARTLTASNEGKVVLRIGRTELVAQTPVRLPAGEALKLQVVKAGNPLLLRLLGSPSDTQLQTIAMRSALPQQRPVASLIRRLLPLIEPAIRYRQQLASTVTSGERPLPPTPPNNPLLPTLKSDRPLPQLQELLQSQRQLNAQIRLQPPAPGIAPATEFQAGRVSGSGLAVSDILLQPGQNPDDAKLLRTIERLLPLRLNLGEPVNAETVRRLFEHSGLFLEPNLAQGEVPVSDLKRGLFELLLQLRQALVTARPNAAGAGIEQERTALLSDLIAQTEGSLARIVLNQLASLPKEEPNQQLWQIDLPIRQTNGEDTVRLKIEKEDGNDPERQSGSRWSVGIDFDIEPIGPMHARLTLFGDEISSRFTAERSSTVTRLEASMHLLERAFFRAGFKVGSLSAMQGNTGEDPRPPFPLLDEKA